MGYSLTNVEGFVQRAALGVDQVENEARPSYRTLPLHGCERDRLTVVKFMEFNHLTAGSTGAGSHGSSAAVSDLVPARGATKLPWPFGDNPRELPGSKGA